MGTRQDQQQKVQLENTSESPCHHIQQYDAHTHTPQMNALSVNGLDQPQTTSSKRRKRERVCVCVCTNEKKKQPHIMLNIMKENTFYFEHFGSGLFASPAARSGFRCDFFFPICQANQSKRIQRKKIYNVFSALQMQRAISF